MHSNVSKLRSCSPPQKKIVLYKKYWLAYVPAKRRNSVSETPV